MIPDDLTDEELKQFLNALKDMMEVIRIVGMEKAPAISPPVMLSGLLVHITHILEERAGIPAWQTLAHLRQGCEEMEMDLSGLKAIQLGKAKGTN